MGQRKYSCLFILLLCTFSYSFSQHFLKAHGKAIVNENQDTILLRGMGLGGWMLQEGYMLQTSEFANAQYQIRNKIEELIGSENTDLFYDAWLANHCTKEDIDSLKSWGFNSVRLPMHYNLFTLPIEDEPVAGENTWLEKGFELTDSLISWCRQNEMYVILDLHAAPGGQGYDQGISDYDPSKPSLWESQENRDKTIALWKKLAERYVDEQWVAGYDLLNEPNWDMSGNVPLKNLYMALTDTIRKVDSQHIIFIEGNWFANDFTGLTPPWDDNLVYSPHKYWSTNDQGSIQWVLDIRKNHNVPLYLGESGENSNVWFRDAIRLLEDNGIGWAWWPMKKVESISGPLSVIKTADYERLLNYWKGSGSKPSEEFASATLMELAENLKIKNCIFQKDVTDAMFRQVYSDETIPFNTQTIPGVVYATDYDMGVVGSAYYDIEVANYNVSTGEYTSWNNGWAYRNDGVDIQFSEDKVNSNGFNVGWIDDGEWMQYDVDIEKTAVYDINVRLAAAGTGGQFHFQVGESDVSEIFTVQSTGDWDNWATVTVRDVILDESDTKLRFFADKAGFNVGSFEFVESGSSNSLSTRFVAAKTIDENHIQLNVNKHLKGPIPSAPAGFSISANGTDIPILSLELDPQNARILYFTVDHDMQFDEVIRVSYADEDVEAKDGTFLRNFSNELVQNNLTFFYPIPGRLQAEDYFFQSGIQLESTTDIGGGQNIGFLDVNDYLDYKVDVTIGGEYEVEYRTASLGSTGGINLIVIDKDGNEMIVDSPNFPSTGGWQNWNSYFSTIELPEGRYTLRVVITRPQFNVNWIEFKSIEPPPPPIPLGVNVFPNPSGGDLNLIAHFSTAHQITVDIFDLTGKLAFSKEYGFNTLFEEPIELTHLATGYYLMLVRLEDGTTHHFKLSIIQGLN